MKSKDDLFDQFKKEEMPIMKWLGLSQLFFILMIMIVPVLYIWVNWIFVLKIEATCLCLCIIISIIYHKLNASMRKEFDKIFSEL